MAEGGNSPSQVRLKPVPPPKPACTSPGILKPVFARSPDTGARTSVRNFVTSYQEKKEPEHSTSSSTCSITATANSDKRDSVNSPQTPRTPLSKPPLLPKPNLPNLQNFKRPEGSLNQALALKSSRHSSQLIAEGSVLGTARKSPSKLFIPKARFSDVENRNSPNVSIVKAPVAKLEEFEHLYDQGGPVRPPRSPKHKSLSCGPFVSEQSSRQVLCNKSASLSRTSTSALELKLKSCSLGRGADFNQVWAFEGTSLNKEERSPVRPPRRRNKSVTTPDSTSPANGQGFNFDQIQPNVPVYAPVYAQINYNLKKNRRVEAQERSLSDVGDCLQKGSVECSENLDLDGVSKEVLSAPENESLPDDSKENCTMTCDINGEEAKENESHVGEIIFETKDGQSQEYSLGGCEGENHKFVHEKRSKEAVDVKDSALCSVFRDCEECGEACADCLPAQILENSIDDSMTSSKLEWVSVRSSLNSSGSDVAGEQLPNQVQEQEETPSSNQLKKYSGEQIDWCQTNDVDSSNVSGLSLSEGLPESPGLGKRSTRHYRRLTSSLPSHGKASRRFPRRQSWNSSTDTAFYTNWNPAKHSSWLDEGDSSSGNLGDLDSSDNAARRSSVEEVDSKGKGEQSVGKRLTLWWSSFGKSGKKYRSNKRHSYFYCDRHDSSEHEDHPSRNNMHVEIKYSHSPVLDITKTPPEVSSSCVALPTSGASQFEYRDMSYKVTSEESIVSDTHSDFEGEGDGCDLKAKNASSETKYDDKKAFYIANELMTSEQVFINALKLLNVDFRNAIEKSGNQSQYVIHPSEFEKIINSLPQLQSLNEDLLRDLKERIQNWPSIKKIADVIVKKGAFLKLYSTYIQNFEAQCNYFDECCQKYPKFAKAVREFEASPVCQKLSVKHFMLKPVQRIPQYRLLLDDYFRHLDPSSPDYNDTKEALKIVSEVAEHANRSIKQGDHLSALLQLQSQLGNFEIIKPGRILLKEGELYKLSRKERQPRYFILLNDCLLYTSYYGSGPTSGLKVNTELPLGGMKVTTPQAEDYHNEFSIISSTRSFTLSARSSHEREDWVKALQSAIHQYTQRQQSFQIQNLNVSRSDGCSEPFKLGREAPIWIQDGRVTKCQSCVAEFTVTFRRHHCRACGKVVCGVCSAFRAPLQYMKFQADRVCEDCFHTLLREFDTPGNKITETIRRELGLRRLDQNLIGSIRSQFKRLGPSSTKKTKKNIPQRLLEVTANDTGSQMCGWLQRRSKRSWKRLWFVLKEQVLYVYKASEDVVALESIPVLGYKVEPMKQNHFQLYEGIDAKLVFQLAHPNQQPLVFSADSENLVNRWIAELQDAAVLK